MTKATTPAAQAKKDESEARALAVTTTLGNPVITAEESARLQLEHRAIALRTKAVELSGLGPNEFDMLSGEEKAAFVDAAAAALEEEKGKLPKLGATPKADLLRVTKDGDVLDIHPDALTQHVHNGWKLVTT